MPERPLTLEARSTKELAELEKQLLARLEEVQRRAYLLGCEERVPRIRALIDAIKEIREMRARSLREQKEEKVEDAE